MNKTLYIFQDESGNFVFSTRGTQYLVFTCLTTQNPFVLTRALTELKSTLIEMGEDIEYFHASNDKQVVRDEVYKILKSSRDYKIEAVIVEKAKTNPTLREPAKLYLKMCEYLLKYILKGYEKTFEKIIIFTDTLPVKKKKKAITKAFKKTIRALLGHQQKFYIFHHASKSHFCLQAVDYCSWAIYRKWGDWGDEEFRPYKMIVDKIRSEFNIFEVGETIYYKK